MSDKTGIGRELACAYAKGLYRSWITGERIVDGLEPPAGTEIETLRGHDLVCWCPAYSPRHADALIELASG